jgi:pyruvate dehydrogenase E2 component (dihydrolipoamide acetyltransferase)
VSPAARHLAEELGVDPSRIIGTGPDGAVTREDVERATARPAAPAPAEPEDAKSRMRQAIAAAMARSKREIPHYYVGTTVDLSAALGWLEAYNARVPVPERLLPGALFIKAVAIALRDFPELNGRWEEGRFVASEGIHVGVAISLRGGGLVAPAIADTDRMPLGELMRRFRDLVSRARAGALRSSEFSGGTITVTSLGDRGAETVYGVIYPPQVALVGFGKVVERPWVAGGQVVPRRTVHVTLSADHRASDGHRGALFVDAVDQILQQPDRLA